MRYLAILAFQLTAAFLVIDQAQEVVSAQFNEVADAIRDALDPDAMRDCAQ